MTSDHLKPEPRLRRATGLPLLVLYGLGITIGAGIYVLIGAAAEQAGQYAPTAFLVAAFVMAFSALSFAELSGRYPQSAGEAVYVDAGFGLNWLTTFTGVMIIFAATIAGAAISVGSAGYIGVLVPLPKAVIITAVVVAMGFVAARGVKESLVFAGILTIIEILGLLAIVFAGFVKNPEMLRHIPSVIPPLTDGAAYAGILSASLIAFFAFIGFDDVVNMVKETENPNRTMPRAIIISLISVTLIYFFVVFVAVQSVDIDALAQSQAPVGLLFERLTGLSPIGIALVAIVATINGVVIEIIMASRVIYGMSKKGRLPKILGKVAPRTQVPLNATLLITIVMLIFAVGIPLDALVSWTSQIILAAFFLVNVSLVIIKTRGNAPPKDGFVAPFICPILGAGTCATLLFGTWLFT